MCVPAKLLSVRTPLDRPFGLVIVCRRIAIALKLIMPTECIFNSNIFDLITDPRPVKLTIQAPARRTSSHRKHSHPEANLDIVDKSASFSPASSFNLGQSPTMTTASTHATLQQQRAVLQAVTTDDSLKLYRAFQEDIELFVDYFSRDNVMNENSYRKIRQVVLPQLRRMQNYFVDQNEAKHQPVSRHGDPAYLELTLW